MGASFITLFDEVFLFSMVFDDAHVRTYITPHFGLFMIIFTYFSIITDTIRNSRNRINTQAKISWDRIM